MDINNGTKTPTDTRVTSGDSGMGGPGTDAGTLGWTTIQPGETVRVNPPGAGPWKVEFRVMVRGRRRTRSKIAQTPDAVLELIEAGEDGEDMNVRVSRPRPPRTPRTPGSPDSPRPPASR